MVGLGRREIWDTRGESAIWHEDTKFCKVSRSQELLPHPARPTIQATGIECSETTDAADLGACHLTQPKPHCWQATSDSFKVIGKS